MQHHILVAFPRTGSTWVTNYGIQSPWTNKLGKNTGSGVYEPFTNVDKITLAEMMQHCQTTIDFLKNERLAGKEYFIKIMVKDINDYDLSNFYDNFYSSTNKIKLINKDVWRIFLSYCYHDYMDWLDADYYLSDDYKPQYFEIPTYVIDLFAQTYTRFVNFDKYDTIWDYDNLTDDYLHDFFKASKKYPRTKYNIIENYEDYLLQDEDMLKNKLHHYLKEYGLTLDEYVL